MGLNIDHNSWSATRGKGTHIMRSFIFILVLSVSNFVFETDLDWGVSTYEDEWATIFDGPLGELSLLDAVNSVAKGVWLKHFRILLSGKDKVLQQELNEYLSSNYSSLYREALGSAGNMHNPKVIALREPIKNAIMASSLVNEVSVALASRCERVASTSYEKFTIWKESGKPIFSAMIWLSTDKCS